MRLVELKCKNCGGDLKLKKGEDIVNCPYCNASYKIDEENMENSGYEFEKGRLKAQTEHVENVLENAELKVPKIIKIIPVIFVAIFVVVVILQFTVFDNSFLKSEEDIQSRQQQESAENLIKQQQEAAENLIKQQQQAAEELESKIHSHNFKYSSGRKSTVFIKSDLNNVVNNNQTNKDKKITVEYKDIATQDVEKIMEIEQMLELYAEYNVLLGYDEEGFINKITIKD